LDAYCKDPRTKFWDGYCQMIVHLLSHIASPY
jgi:hypothetical protein